MHYYQKFFTNGATLPKKFSQEEFEKYFREFQNGSEEAKEELILHNLRLVTKIVNTKFASCPEKEELISEGIVGLMKALDTFVLEKGVKFSSYAGRCITNEILMYLRRSNKHSKVESLNQSIRTSKDDDSLTELDQLIDLNTSVEDKVLNARYNLKVRAAVKKVLTPREYEVIAYRFGFENDSLKQAQVATILGISRSYVSKIEAEALKKLHEQLDDNINEIAEYRYNAGTLDVSSIHKDLTCTVFKNLLSLFPKKEKEMYITKLKGENSNFSENERKEIEDILLELFVYYQEIRKKDGLNNKTAINETAEYARKHSLRFRYPEQTIKEIRKAINSLKPEEQKFIISIYGKDIPLFTHSLEEKNIDSKLLHALDYKLNKQARKKVAKERIKSSSNKTINPTTLVETPSSEVSLVEKSATAIEGTEEQKMEVEKASENKSETQVETKSIIEMYSKEELMYAVPLLTIQFQACIYLKHGRDFKYDFPLEKLSYVKETVAYHIKNYKECPKHIDRILNERKKMKVNCRFEEKINKEYISRILASINNWKASKEELIKAKENNLKSDLYDRFYKLYGNIITELELKNIIQECISKCNIEEEKNIEYVCQLKVETAILVFLANKYKENPDGEEALNILIQINAIFISEIKQKYPQMKEVRIEKAIESVLNTYTEEKIFSIELMRKLLR